ncbi:MAG: response regulator, partial [Candidatus Auribacterota bacterium]|nr:response regulator [Candidatus Auribacterota bacterium]
MTEPKKDIVDCTPRILVVDDEKNIRDMLKRNFKFLGFQVEEASNGKEALSLMAQKRFEVVISDINMPEMTGIELLREIRKGFPMTHCIMVTGYVTMENVLCCMRLGADTCIFKPLEDMSELENAVKRAVEHLKHW